MSMLKTHCLIAVYSVALAGTPGLAQTTVPYPTAGGERQIPAGEAGPYVRGGVLSAPPSDPDVSYGVGREKASATGGQAGGNPNKN